MYMVWMCVVLSLVLVTSPLHMYDVFEVQIAFCRCRQKTQPDLLVLNCIKGCVHSVYHISINSVYIIFLVLMVCIYRLIKVCI